MDDATSPTDFASFRSPWRNLAWSFRKSRDAWKAKYRDLKREQKRLQNQLRDVRVSRDAWRRRAEAAATPPPPAPLPAPCGEKKGF
jgi:hypothetical protein